jgi:hypothetical protein
MPDTKSVIDYKPDSLEEAIREIKHRGNMINIMYLALKKIAEMESKDVFDERPDIATKAIKKVMVAHNKHS